MKKLYLGAVAGVSALALLTGCGGSKNQVVCSATMEEDGQKATAEVVAELDSNDKIKDATISYKFDDQDAADQFYSMYQMLVSMSEQSGEKLDIDIKKSGKTITISNYAALEAMQSEDEDSEKLIGMSKDDFIKKVESDNSDGAKWSCK